MAKPSLQQLLNSTKTESPSSAGASIAPGETEAKPREVHKPGEVNISAYFPSEVKAALRMAQAKTGKNVKQCLAEALQDFFRKHNVPVAVSIEQSR